MGKKLDEMLAYLGTKYTVKTVDYESCVYRDLGNGYDLEVSGVDTRKKTFKVSVYVWDISSSKGLGAKIVEKVHDIRSKEALRSVLDQLAEKYLSPQS